MPEHVNSFAPMLLGAVFVSLATVTIAFDGPARADDVCIEQPPHPVAEGMPGSVPYKYAACHSCHTTATTEVLAWNIRYDRARGRSCWFLLDAHGRDVTKAHVRSSAAPAPTSYVPPTTFSSKIASLFGNSNFIGTPANAAPESNAPPVSPPQIGAPNSPRKHEDDSANAPAPTSNAPPPTTTFSSKIASLFGNFNFMGTPANAAPESNAPPVSPAQIGPPNSPRKHEGDSANAKKTDSTVQTAQRSIGKGHEVKRVSQVTIQPEERALYEEFLRWREYEKIFKTR